MKNVDFRYPGTDHNQLTDVNIKLTLSSRVAVIGANGAGKSTLIKMIVGETLPSNAEEKNTSFFLHHNLRIAYIAQHSFHHVEAHYEESPCAYIAWRFKESVDREKMESEGYRLSDEEKEKVQAWGLEGIWSRRMKAGRLEYEVKKRGVREKDNKYFTKEELLDMGFSRSVKQADEKVSPPACTHTPRERPHALIKNRGGAGSERPDRSLVAPTSAPDLAARWLPPLTPPTNHPPRSPPSTPVWTSAP